jgi:hypothetical protein
VKICFARSEFCLQQRIKIENWHDPQIIPLANHEIATIGFGDQMCGGAKNLLLENNTITFISKYKSFRKLGLYNG